MPFEAGSAYCAAHQMWCNAEMVQPLPRGPAAPGAAPLEPTHTVYNANTGTLTMIFGEPLILVNPGRIGITVTDGGGGDTNVHGNGTVTTLAGAEVSTINNRIKSWVFAFTLSGEASSMISGELDEYGSVLQVIIDAKAMYVADPVADLTDRNGGLPLAVPVVAIR